MNNYKVYIHICPNNKKYIGITGQSVERRWQKGKGYAYGNNVYFYNAIGKYGWENIRHIILFSKLSKEEAEQKEIDLIKEYKTSDRKFGYNLNNGGNSCGKHSEEYKKRMSKIQKNLWANDDKRKKKMSEIFTGRIMSEETKQKLREANLGKKQSKETKEKRAAKLRGVSRPDVAERLRNLPKGSHPMCGKKGSEKQKEAARKNSVIGCEACKKPIIQFTKDGNIVREYFSAAEAIKINNYKSNHISECCKGKYKSFNNYIWKYKKECDDLLGK